VPTNAVIASTGTTVAVLVAVLVLLGLAMIVVALWLVRSTRTDPAALGPLEVMGERRWRKGEADVRQANLETARPPGAPPPAPMVPLDVAASSNGPAPGADPTPPELPTPESAETETGAAETKTSAAETETSAAETETGAAETETGPAETEASIEICESSMQESAVSAHRCDGDDSEGDASGTK
jgi:hypothetical protein